jgi:hypothetical protein
MGRKIQLINILRRVYNNCTNSEKDKIVSDAITAINALPKE